MSNLTKKAIENEFTKLLESKKFDMITVKEICENIGITRQTFYYHFDDIYALMKDVFDQKAKEVIGEHKTFDSWKVGFENIFEVMLKSQTIVTNTYRAVSREYIENYLFKSIYELLYPVIKDKAKDYPKVTDTQVRFIAHFYKYAFAGMVVEWVDRGMLDDYHMIIENFSTIIQGDFIDALNRFNQI